MSGESFLRRVWSGVAARLGLHGGDKATVRESVEEIVGDTIEAAGTAIDPAERAMLGNVFTFGELTVAEVKVPRADIVAVDRGASLEALREVFLKAKVSRLPVYRETLDNVIGMVHVKDLLPYWGGERPYDLRSILREVIFVPPTKSALALLSQMRHRRCHLALVVDEYGGTDGLVTIEDLVEKIVGDIADEHDAPGTPQIVDLPDGRIECDGRAPIAELAQKLGRDLRPADAGEGVETVGGLIVTLADHLPVVGERVIHPSGVEFEVIDAGRRRVKRARVKLLPQSAPAARPG
ncbi:MAG: HlyC/CorC family transporter [Alphaproteobacteria bacterium]|nr:HlyC/CorC family transporter [Alphaproteobacteria bacterium]